MATDKQLKSKANKRDTCNKYKEYITIIYEIGNKIIFQKDLFELLELFELETNKTRFSDALKELERMDIIKKINYMNTGYKVIMLRNFGIRFMESTIDESRATPSLPKVNGSLIFKERLLKCSYCIFSLRKIKEVRKLTGFDIYKYYSDKNLKGVSTINLNCFKGNIFLNTIKNKFEKYMYMQNFKDSYERELRIKNKLKSNLNKEGVSKEANLITFLRFKKQRIDVVKMKVNNNKVKVVLCYWNYEDNFKIDFIEKMAKVALYIKDMFEPYIGNGIEFKFVCINSNTNITEKLKKIILEEKIIDTGTEKIKKSKLDHILKQKFGTIAHQIKLDFLTLNTI